MEKNNHFVQIPESLHTFINPNKDAIGTGLYYVSLGSRCPTDDQEDLDKPSYTGKSKTLRVSISSTAQSALDDLIRSGLSKKEAFIKAVEYLQAKPHTLLGVKI